MIDVAAHFGLDRVPFGSAANADPVAGAAFARALDELMAWLRGGARLIAIEGEPGSGRTRLLRAAADRVAQDGVRARLLEHARMVDPAADADVLFVDEAEALAVDERDALVARARSAGGGAVVLALGPGGGDALPEPARAIRLGPLEHGESARFIDEQAGRAGRPDLFAPAATDAIARAAGGSPRLLRRLAGLALVEATLDGARRVEEPHALAAAAQRLPERARAANGAPAAQREPPAVSVAPGDAGPQPASSSPPAIAPPLSPPATSDVSPRLAPPVHAGIDAPRASAVSRAPPRRTRTQSAVRMLGAVAAATVALLVAWPPLRAVLDAPTVRTVEERASITPRPAPPPAPVAPEPRQSSAAASAVAVTPAPPVVAAIEAPEIALAEARIVLEPAPPPVVVAPRTVEPAPRIAAPAPSAVELARVRPERVAPPTPLAPAPPVARDWRPDGEPALAADQVAQMALPEAAAPTRVFIHHAPADTAAAQAVARSLASRGWRIVELRARNTPVSRANARFFFAADGKAARSLADVLSDEIAAPTAVRDMRSYSPQPRPGTLEIWLPTAGGSG